MPKAIAKTEPLFSKKAIQKRANLTEQRLASLYPDAACALDFTNPWESLVSTILSAQCTDARVNQVTPALFARWPGPAEIADAPLAEIEEMVRPTGFFRNKALHIRDSANLICQRHGGQVPDNAQELMRLPGVGRKTANVVLFAAYGINEGIAVDTHVKRVSFRLGLTRSKDPLLIEQDLLPLFPRPEWGVLNLRMVLFGREICKARSPRCPDCPMNDFCPREGLRPDQK